MKRILFILAVGCTMGVYAQTSETQGEETLGRRDTVFVQGGVQHDGLLDWSPVAYHSNSYLDVGVVWQRSSLPPDAFPKGNGSTFKELRAKARMELTQWPMPGYETDFRGYGLSHLSVAASFTWGEITVGDVYGQFGSGLILNLYEERSLGIDGALRGAKIEVRPYKGLHLTALGGKQRRYWSAYDDKAWGWNYGRDAALGADMEVHIDEYSAAMRAQNMRLSLGASWVSRYEAQDTVLIIKDKQLYQYRFPQWIGAGDVRVRYQWKDFDLTAEYARKANDPGLENEFSYRPGEALLVSAGYAQKGLSVLAQIKRSDNMAFRSERMRTGIAGRINYLPTFTPQHTYALAALYPYATQYVDGEWAFQAEVRYTWPRKSKMGGRYGTTMKWSGAHIRGLASTGSWAIDKSAKGEYYTEVNWEIDKRLSKRWWLHGMLMYQRYNQGVVEGHGAMIRSGIAVVDARVKVNEQIAMRGELQYLYSPDHKGQWCFALYELTLFKHWTLSGQWMYNIGYAPEANNEHFYTAGVTFRYRAHRANIGYTKTQEGFNCSGGICRYVPQMKGICASYSFTW